MISVNGKDFEVSSDLARVQYLQFVMENIVIIGRLLLLDDIVIILGGWKDVIVLLVKAIVVCVK